jgi:protein-disulfide isomerase
MSRQEDQSAASVRLDSSRSRNGFISYTIWRCCPFLRDALLTIQLLICGFALVGCASVPTLSDIVGTAPSLGDLDAPVTIVEFGDYQCGPCSIHGKRLHTLVEERPEEVRLVFRHCPSANHPVGMRASLVAAAADEQGRFWDVHWRLVEEGPIRDDGHLSRILEEAGVERDILEAALRSGQPQRVVDRDIALADRLEIRGTPTTFLGSRRYEGVLSIDVLRSEIRRLLGQERRPESS